MRRYAAETEGALERIWDLHDRLSDAILASSRARLLLPPPAPPRDGGGGGWEGCVFVKGERHGATTAAAEVRSLHAIRSALEDLESHLEFLKVRLFLFLLLLCPRPSMFLALRGIQVDW
jgi:hypothetical protein